VFSSTFVAFFLFLLFKNKRVAICLLVLVSTFYAIRLMQANKAWAKAAKLSETLIADIKTLPFQDDKTIIFLNLPGIVFHTGISESLMLFRGLNPEKIWFASWTGHRSDLDAETMDVEIRSTGPNEYRLHSNFPAIPYSGADSHELPVETTVLDRHSLQFKISDAEATIYCFTSGHLRQLTEHVMHQSAHPLRRPY
jgi:hypothetical protein